MTSGQRLLVLVPAHNEAESLPTVVSEVRATVPGADLLVIDDGSDDHTRAVLDALDVAHVRLSEREGLGAAVRAGLRWASRAGYETVVRIDGDGQHDARDIEAIAETVRHGRADVAIGTRYSDSRPEPDGHARRLAQRGLAVVLSAITGRPVTDATSGFCAFGPRALRLLTARHPGGYPEVEMRLLLHRHGLTVCEVPVRPRPRVAGRTTLTPVRLAAAAARILFALAVTPLRPSSPAAVSAARMIDDTSRDGDDPGRKTAVA
jgi:glycosyltransferase involved in cell wall biosynthesis